MEQQTNYQFVMIPQQLSSCLDANCGKMLTTLIGLSTIMSKEDGWFYRSNKELQLDTRFSQNLVIATLDTLYQAGIINVDCIGKSRGHRSNRIHINYDSFGVYQQYSFNEIRNNPDLWIETVSYKNHYSPSYCKEIGKEIGNTLGKRIGKKVTTNTDTTDTSNSIDIINTKENNITNIENKSNIDNLHNTKEDNLSKDIKNDLQKVNTIEETQYSKEDNLSKDIENDFQKVNTCYEGNLPTCKIDIIQEEKSLKEFEEESLKDMKDSFNIVCTKVKINEDMLIKGFECCSNFYDKYQNLDYQLLLNNPQQFLTNNEIKLGSLSQSITTYTGVTVSKQITTQMLKDYVELAISK